MAETFKLKVRPRRLVLLFDGTWNERSSFTNIARMFEAIDDYKPKDYDDHPDKYKGHKKVQLVKYFSGVGTGNKFNLIDKYAGGVLGYGLSEHVEKGYAWLSNNYRVGDEIFVFGFGRGAYSARSLVSLVHKCGGVLKRDKQGHDLQVTDPILQDAYAMYQSCVVTLDENGNDKKDEDLEADFARHLYHFHNMYEDRVQDQVKVKMLGVWNTVGALGIPDSAFTVLKRQHHEFHDQGLPCIVQNAYHALALDEYREDFKPTLWKNRKSEEQKVKQVWFMGSHANVGGGAPTVDKHPDDLWQYSYIWMQANAHKNGLRFHWMYQYTPECTNLTDYTPTKVGIATEFDETEVDATEVDATEVDPTKPRISLTAIEDSYSNFMFTLYSKLRDPVNRQVDGVTGAKLHWSVKERILQDDDYRPENLCISAKDGCTLIQYEKRCDGKKITGKEKEANVALVKTDWPIEYDDPSKPDPSTLPSLEVVNECSCKKELASHSCNGKCFINLGFPFQSCINALFG